MDLFSYNSANGNMEERVRQGAAKHVEETGFVENWGESLRLEIDENSSASRYVQNGLYQERTNKIMSQYEAGNIPDNIMEQFSSEDQLGQTTIDYSGLGNWVNENLDEKVLSDKEIQDGISDDLKMKRELSQDVFNRANWWGKFGQFAGTAHAMALDPIYIPTYFFGIGAAAKGVGYLSRVGRAAAVGGAVEAGMEGLKQPIVYRWKKDIGVDYSMKDALAQVAMAGVVGAGLMGGTVSAAALSKQLGRFVKKNVIYGNKISEEAGQAVDNLVRETGRMEPDLPAREGIENLEGEVKAQETRDSVDDMEPVDGSIKTDEGVVEEGIDPVDAERPIMVETITGDQVNTTYAKVSEMANTVESDVKMIKGCFGI